MPEDFDIAISADGMEATIHVPRAEGASARRTGDLEAALLAAGVRHGIDADRIHDIEAAWCSPEFWFHDVIARGRRPRAGRPGFIIVAFTPFLGSGEHDAYDRIDYQERQHLIAARRDEIIARRYLAHAGETGLTVRGEEIPPAENSEETTGLGAGASIDEDRFIRATRDGVILHKPGQILDVIDVYEHKGSVGPESGNLRSPGTLIVRGDVQPGFRVEADGDLVIVGDVDQASFRSGGNAEVARAIIGGPEVHARCGGDLSCKRLQSAHATVEGRLDFEREIIGSHLRAESLASDSPRGTVLGCEIKLMRDLRCAVLGSPGGSALTVTLGTNWALQDRIRRLEGRQSSRGKNRRSSASGRSRSARREKGLDERLAGMKLELRRSQRELESRAQVEVTRRIHAGTTIAIGSVQDTISEDLGPTRIRLDPQKERLIQEKLKP